MENLILLINTLASAPAYISIFFILIAVVIILLLTPLVLGIIKRVKNITRVKIGGNEIDLSGPAGDKIVASVQKIDGKTYKLVLNSVEEVTEKYHKNEQNLKNKIYADLKKSREECINKAIESIRIDFTNNNPNLENFETADNFFSLFLEVEFGKVLRDELSSLIHNERLSDLSDIETLDKLKDIIDSCTNKIALNIRKYTMLIDKKLILDSFDSSSGKIRDHVGRSIKYFVTLSKTEKEDLIKLSEKKLEELENKLKTILEVKE
jgi:hypothetical protein